MNQQDEDKVVDSTGNESDEVDSVVSEPGDASPAADADQEAVAERAEASNAARPAKSSSWTTRFSLLLSLAAITASAYLWLEQRAQDEISDRLSRVSIEVNSGEAEVARLQNEIEALTDIDLQIESRLKTLTTQFDRQFADIPLRITRMERTLDTIPGINDRARSAWILAEAEYFMRIANAQLSLAGNIEVALRGLELADAKLREIADPRLTRIRALLIDEQTALKSLPRPDSEGIVLALGSLARSLDSLPLNATSPRQFGERNGASDAESGLQRAWRVMIDALLSIISVKRDQAPITPLMTAGEESMLIRSLDIELQIGRLALIRNEAELYRRSLEDVTERLENYFDQDAPQVQAALETIKQAAAAELPGELPDISGSLSLLLQLSDEAENR
jgi:uroporphyrin-3 C-methyltransferase